MNNVENPEVIQEINAEELDQVAGGISGNYFKYTVVKGDTLHRIAKRFGTTVDILVKINKIKNRNLIHVGQVLLIPYGG